MSVFSEFKNHSFISHLLLTIGVFSFIVFGFFSVKDKMEKPQIVQADAKSNIRGFAWGADNTPSAAGVVGGIGWISFNNLECDIDGNGYVDSGACGGNNSSTVSQNYGVNLNDEAGGFRTLTGYAWSSNYGWINFSPTDTPPPSSVSGNPYQGPARLNGNNFEGWARLDAVDTGSNWDGWISLKGTNYRVSLDLVSGEFSGYAWGGGGTEGVGWISFNCSAGGLCSNVDYKVKLVIPRTVSCFANPSSGESGISVVWSAVINPSTPPVNYTWSKSFESTVPATPNNTISGSGNSITTPSITGDHGQIFKAIVSVSGQQPGSCVFAVANNCIGPGDVTILNGQCKTYYKSSKAEAGENCEPQSRCCSGNPGVLSGSYTNLSCYPRYEEF